MTVLSRLESVWFNLQWHCEQIVSKEGRKPFHRVQDHNNDERQQTSLLSLPKRQRWAVTTKNRYNNVTKSWLLQDVHVPLSAVGVFG